MIHDIEAGRVEWPRQVLVGFVIALSKHNGRLDSQGFRPICLFSVLYRCWAGIRARQLVKWLSRHLDPDTMGFVPGRSAVDLWLVLQSEIELSLQMGGCTAGFSADITKAFNNLPRSPLLEVASHIGFPDQVIVPWTNFLGSVTRRFKIRDALSCSISSSSGFPEGDPLSPVAMLVANAIFHQYMKAFLPDIRALSYADNYSGLGGDAATAIKGVLSAQSCCELLGLELDSDKTYVWATEPSQRQILQMSGFQLLDNARELGGILSFDRRRHNREMKLRCQDLGPLWIKLARARRPLVFKLRALSSKFWAHALHGAAGCDLPDSMLTSLRSSAVKALGASSSGVSPILRLSLSGDVMADPGYFMIWTTIRDIRRVLLSQPGFLLSWRVFCKRFEGKLLQGPFSRFFVCCGTLQWTVLEPPWIRDHEGLSHDFMRMPLSLLRLTVEHAWFQVVASRHCHRRTMSDLHGNEPSLARLDWTSLSPLDKARLAAIQSGAFMFPAQQAKFDKQQTGDCQLCQVRDDNEHRLCVCPRYQAHRPPCRDTLDRWVSLPSCLTHHLLPPRQPSLSAFRAMLHAIPDGTAHHQHVAHPQGRQHLFTDGTCTQDTSGLNLAAWGVVLANTGHTLAAGPVHGVLQTTPRAELCAVLAAVKWIVQARVVATLWIDALAVASGVSGILQGLEVGRFCENADLWEDIESWLQQARGGLIVQHIPSHLEVSACVDPFEEWVAVWNGKADQAAGLANSNRGQQVWDVVEQARSDWHRTATDVRRLRRLYFDIAEYHQTSSRTEAPDVECPPADTPLPVDPSQSRLSEEVSLGWRLALREAPLPEFFMHAVGDFLLSQDMKAETTYKVSLIELLFMVKLDGLEFPVCCPTTGRWIRPDALVFHGEPLTAAVQLKLLRIAMRYLVPLFGPHIRALSGLNVSDLGVLIPLDGWVLRVDACLLQQGRISASDSFSKRPIKGTRDWARSL